MGDFTICRVCLPKKAMKFQSFSAVIKESLSNMIFMMKMTFVGLPFD